MALVLVGGGSRSGKSTYALTLARALPQPRAFVATAQAYDDEMRDRIARHQEERAEEFATCEEPFDISAAIKKLEGTHPVIIVDCLTLWLTNLMLAEQDWRAAGQDLVAALPAQRDSIVFVTNEVGSGIVPENALARAFRDAAGTLNQWIAAQADEVILAVAGLPMKVK